MDIGTIITPIISAGLSIAAVSAFVIKYVKPVVKYVRLAADAINALDHVATALEDGTINEKEVEQIRADVIKFKADMAK
jgi:hypothetical protein